MGLANNAIERASFMLTLLEYFGEISGLLLLIKIISFSIEYPLKLNKPVVPFSVPAC